MKLAEVIAKVKSLEVKVASLQNMETRNCQLEKDVSEHKEIISELKEKDVFQTKIINELKSKLNQSTNKFKKLETSIFSIAKPSYVLDTNQGKKKIIISNVREQQFENSGQLIAIVKKIVKNIINKNVTVTRAYRTGEQPGNSQKNRPIIASLWMKNSVSQ